MFRNMARMMIRAGAVLFCLGALAWLGPLTSASRLVDIAGLFTSFTVFWVGVVVVKRGGSS